MPINLRIIIIVIGISFMVYVVKHLLKKNIDERNAIFWMVSTCLLGLIALFPGILDLLASIIGIDYPPTLLFLVSIMILFIILMNQAIRISILNKRVKELAQISAIQYDEVTENAKKMMEKINYKE